MTDPYAILETNSSVSDDEVKQAYRKLAKKYHPDLNPDNPVAERKMQEINSAYEQIKTARQGGPSIQQQQQQRAGGAAPGQGHSGQGQNPFGEGDPFGPGGMFWEFRDIFQGGQQRQRQQSTRSPRMQAVYSFIANRQYPAALQVLSEMIERDAEWFFLSAIASAGTGNRLTALTHAQEATRLDPGNEEYQSLFQQFQQGIFTYRQAGQGYGFNMNTVSKTIIQLCVAQICCMLCCRPCG
ncbi:MAG: DnaJ domain-containing protein [Gorillibacterium sp.]|nr:DnaJ domain-containing protein [Gorillibacterium sp.]